METFFSVNILQLICVSLKLDHVISWRWTVSVSFHLLSVFVALLNVVVIFAASVKHTYKPVLMFSLKEQLITETFENKKN